MFDLFQEYLTKLQSHKLTDITEHSHRPALQALLEGIAATLSDPIKILHEPARSKTFGAPDFRVDTRETIVGYVENKKITQSLDETIASDQIEKYNKLNKNLLITNYVEFIWLRDKKEEQRVELCKPGDLAKKGFKLDKEAANRAAMLIQRFMREEAQPIGDPKTIAALLAERTRYLYAYLHSALEAQAKDETLQNQIWLIFQAFQENVYADINVEQFADTYAQTIAYGLFTARLNADCKEKITVRNADEYVPRAFQLLQDMLSKIKDIYKDPDSNWIIDELLHTINHIDQRELQQNLAFSQQEADDTDPYLYFYETFLAAYNPALRKGRGVYYTPAAVVRFIVGAIDEVLKSTFQIPDGLADDQRVTVLDFATGTGTFLFEVFETIHRAYPFDGPEGKQLVRSHILKNIYGFEYLSAPYAIAHLKLSQFLAEKGYTLTKDERIRLFLTNTLEKVTPQTTAIMPQLAAEGKLAQKVKDQNIFVITGNPPYAGHSSNESEHKYQELKTYKSGKSKLVNRKKDTWIGGLLNDYFKVDGKDLGEKNPKWLQDDYVKFIRFAQHKISQSGQGVVAIITNHAFLDNPTFRGMRQSLMQTFDQLYLLDLHGNSKKKERVPAGYAPPLGDQTEADYSTDRDENVFDIQQGVSISVLVKRKDHPGPAEVFRADLFGTRETKYRLLANPFGSVQWQRLQPTSPFYLFAHQDADIKAEYEQYWSVNQIFKASNVGIVTARDAIVINTDEVALMENVKQLYVDRTDFPDKKYHTTTHKNPISVSASI